MNVLSLRGCLARLVVINYTSPTESTLQATASRRQCEFYWLIDVFAILRRNS